MSDCERYEALISAMLDGELTEDEQAEVQRHLASCPDCAAIYAAFAEVSEALKAEAEAEPLPAALHEGIMARVRVAEKAKKTHGAIVRLRPILAAAACLVVLAGTLLALRNSFRMGKSESSGAAPALYSAGAAESVQESAVDDGQQIMFAKAENAAAPESAEVTEAEAATEDSFAAPEEPAAGAFGGSASRKDTANEADRAAGATLYGADEVYPTVMVNGALYEWHRGSAVHFEGIPDGCAYYGEVLHTDAETPQADGEFASLFPVSGTIYTVPGNEDEVYLQLTTDWMEETVVQFDRCG